MCMTQVCARGNALASRRDRRLRRRMAAAWPGRRAPSLLLLLGMLVVTVWDPTDCLLRPSGCPAAAGGEASGLSAPGPDPVGCTPDGGLLPPSLAASSSLSISQPSRYSAPGLSLSTIERSRLALTPTAVTLSPITAAQRLHTKRQVRMPPRGRWRPTFCKRAQRRGSHEVALVVTLHANYPRQHWMVDFTAGMPCCRMC